VGRGTENGYILTDRVFDCAVKRGSLSMLQWLKDNSCPWSKESCSLAVEMGDLEKLQWLRAMDVLGPKRVALRQPITGSWRC